MRCFDWFHGSLNAAKNWNSKSMTPAVPFDTHFLVALYFNPNHAVFCRMHIQEAPIDGRAFGVFQNEASKAQSSSSRFCFIILFCSPSPSLSSLGHRLLEERNDHMMALGCGVWVGGDIEQISSGPGSLWNCDGVGKSSCITYLQLGGPCNPRSITTRSCKFLHFMLQWHHVDVWRPLFCLIMLWEGEST